MILLVKHLRIAAYFILFIASLFYSFIATASAAEIELNGYLLGSFSSRISNKPLITGEQNNWLSAEQRLQFELSVGSEQGDMSLTSKIDVVNDQVDGNVNLDVREFYVEYIAENYEIRGGRQMLTWGVADRLFINDVFPKDWAAFFSGKPLEYMKLGSDMLKLSVFADNWDLEVALIPTAQFDRVPTSARYIVFDLGLATRKPDNHLSNGEAALRLHTSLGTTDIAFYASRGFWHQPDKGISVSNRGLNIIYPRLNTYGVTLQDSLLGGVISFEAGIYQSADDVSGVNPLIANSQSRYLLAYERDVATDVNLSLQLYGEYMDQYEGYLPSALSAYFGKSGPKPLPQHRKIITVNLRALWLNQTLTTSLFTIYVGDSGGRMINLDIHYSISDEMSVSAGFHQFLDGPDSWMFGMMKNDDNIYLNAKWSF